MRTVSSPTTRRQHLLPALLVLALSLAATGVGTALVSHHKLLPWIFLFAGGGLSLLLAGITRTQAQRRSEAEQANAALQDREAQIQELNSDLERRIAERTSELREANSRLETAAKERQDAQARLARFAAVAEATSDVVTMATLEGALLFINQAGRRTVGIKSDAEMNGLKMGEFYPDWVNDLFAREVLPTAIREGSWTGEVALLHRDGHEIPVSMVGLILRAPDGRPEYMACTLRDISDQHNLEESLRSALAKEKELNQLKGNFISMVSHEIRTPLALILSSSEILSRYFDRLPADKRQRHLQNINESVQRMSALMEDVLLFSRAEAGRMEFKPAPLDLRCFCRQLLDELVSATGQRCPLELDEAGLEDTARGDESLLRHILGNLLTNAIKYSAPGSPVTLRARRREGLAVLEVADRGIGIPAPDQARLFTPFHRGANAGAATGTGLGLVIVRRCVERHGGQLHIASQLGAGTVVTVELPMFSPAHTQFLSRFG